MITGWSAAANDTYLALPPKHAVFRHRKLDVGLFAAVFNLLSSVKPVAFSPHQYRSAARC
jgi:hypothetical protein